MYLTTNSIYVFKWVVLYKCKILITRENNHIGISSKNTASWSGSPYSLSQNPTWVMLGYDALIPSALLEMLVSPLPPPPFFCLSWQILGNSQRFLHLLVSAATVPAGLVEKYNSVSPHHKKLGEDWKNKLQIIFNSFSTFFGFHFFFQ